MEATGFASVLAWQALLRTSLSKLPRLQAAPGPGLQRPRAGKGRGQNKLIRRRGKRGAGHRGNLHILSSPGHQTNSVASISKSESALGARSRQWLRPCLLRAGQAGREMEKLTPSLSCQGQMLPGRWSSQCPHSQTHQAQVCADSTGPARCGASGGPRGASPSFPDASACCHKG